MISDRSRIIALTTLAIYALMQGWQYLTIATSPRLTPPGLVFVDAFIPLTAYALLWIAIGVGAAVAIWWKRTTRLALAGVLFIDALWALSLVLASIMEHAQWAWLNAAPYAAIASMVVVIMQMVPTSRRGRRWTRQR